MQNAWIWIVVMVVILTGGFLFWQNGQSANTAVDLQPSETTVTPAPADTSTGTSTTSAGSDSAAMSASVSYGADGYSPSQVTVKKGATVTWTAEGRSDMWVATAPHPAHTGYPGDGTSRSTHCASDYAGPKPFDQCAPGASYSFKFDQVGTFAYHDHMNASNFGKVVVVE